MDVGPGESPETRILDSVWHLNPNIDSGDRTNIHLLSYLKTCGGKSTDPVEDVKMCFVCPV